LAEGDLELACAQPQVIHHARAIEAAGGVDLVPHIVDLKDDRRLARLHADGDLREMKALSGVLRQQFVLLV
jgi:hypothetical protein